MTTLKAELGSDKSLEDTKARGHKTWNDLFRANLFSRKFYETKENGDPYYYSPYDGKVYDGYMFTDNGFWDTFRSQFPLTCILHPCHGKYA